MVQFTRLALGKVVVKAVKTLFVTVISLGTKCYTKCWKLLLMWKNGKQDHEKSIAAMIKMYFPSLQAQKEIMKQGTKFIHAGVEPDPSTGAIMTPIYQTSTYVQSAPAEHKGYEYARSQNPTRFALEKAFAAIENGKYGLCFSSGVAATDAVIKLLQPGDEVIAGNDLYGGTYRLFTKVFAKFGIRFHYINMQDANDIDKYINNNTKLIWVETPTNPLMNIIDLAAVSSVAALHNILVCVDNTFASPYLQNPLDLGAHIVLHSATKYL